MLFHINLCRGGLLLQMSIEVTLLVPLHCLFVFLRLLRRFSGRRYYTCVSYTDKKKSGNKSLTFDKLFFLFSSRRHYCPFTVISRDSAKGRRMNEMGDMENNIQSSLFYVLNMIHNIITILFHVSFTVLQVF